jgi:hypothetical protein
MQDNERNTPPPSGDRYPQSQPELTPASGGYQQIDPYMTEQPPQKRGLGTSKVLLIVFGSLGACLLICVIAGFFLIRSIQGGFEEVVEDGMGAVVEEQIGATGAAQPGTYVITTDDILAQLNTQLTEGGANIDELFVRISPGNIVVLGIESEGQDLEYTATVAAIDGRLDVTNIEASNSFLNFIAPGSSIANGLEAGVNDYLDQNNLTLTSLSTAEGEITLVVE